MWREHRISCCCNPENQNIRNGRSPAMDTSPTRWMVMLDSELLFHMIHAGIHKTGDRMTHEATVGLGKYRSNQRYSKGAVVPLQTWDQGSDTAIVLAYVAELVTTARLEQKYRVTFHHAIIRHRMHIPTESCLVIQVLSAIDAERSRVQEAATGPAVDL